jgi:hypothetical protein
LNGEKKVNQVIDFFSPNHLVINKRRDNSQTNPKKKKEICETSTKVIFV